MVVLVLVNCGPVYSQQQPFGRRVVGKRGSRRVTSVGLRVGIEINSWLASQYNIVGKRRIGRNALYGQSMSNLVVTVPTISTISTAVLPEKPTDN